MSTTTRTLLASALTLGLALSSSAAFAQDAAAKSPPGRPRAGSAIRSPWTARPVRPRARWPSGRTRCAPIPSASPSAG